MEVIIVICLIIGGSFLIGIATNRELRKCGKFIYFPIAMFFVGLAGTIYFCIHEEEIKLDFEGIFIAANFPTPRTSIHFYDINRGLQENMAWYVGQQKTFRKLLFEEKIIPGVRFHIYHGRSRIVNIIFVEKLVIYPNRFDPPISYELTLDEEYL